MQHSIITEENVSCLLRDGTLLRSDVYRPNDNAEHPVLMLRLPYDKTTPRYYEEYLDVARMVKAGYVVILQDVRGRFASNGEFYPFVNERKDGYDAVEWAAALPYANGRVGLFGMSYHGYTQLAAAVEKPPSLKAIAPVMTMADPWADLLGTAETASSSATFQTWTLGSIVENQLQRRNDPKVNQVQLCIEKLPQLLGEHPACDWSPMKELDPDSFYFDVMEGNLSDEWIDHMQIKDQLQHVDIPALFMGGWFDALLPSTLEAYHHYDGIKMLWLGPWTHEEMTGRAGEMFFANAATGIGIDQVTDPTDIHIKWFDRWLKDKPLTIEKPVHFYRLGQKKWEAAEKWPPPSEKRELYLASEGKAHSRYGDGRLYTETKDQETAVSMLLDPNHPVPTRGGGVLIAGHESGMFAIHDIQDRKDVLVYTASQQTDDLFISGAVRAVIWVSSPTPWTDLAVRLSDVGPEGEVYNIIDTFHRQETASNESPEFMDVTIGHTAYLIKKGHRLRLDLAASNAPLYDVNVNNGKTTKTAVYGEAAHEHIYQGGQRASKIVLPIAAV